MSVEINQNKNHDITNRIITFRPVRDIYIRNDTPKRLMERQFGERYDPSEVVAKDIAALDPQSHRVLMASGIKAARQPIEQDGFDLNDDIG
jgi:hypothetical protein